VTGGSFVNAQVSIGLYGRVKNPHAWLLAHGTPDASALVRWRSFVDAKIAIVLNDGKIAAVLRLKVIDVLALDVTRCLQKVS
jgi:hypothetical protein